jgi:hypothetical protein
MHQVDPGSVPRLAVTWQHPLTGRTTAVGLLTHVDSIYRFCYFRSAGAVAGFQPFLGFPDLERRYEATALFPLFAQRVMRRSRPDFDRYLHALRLEVDASEWSILGRSQGQREGDGIGVFPEPDVDKAGVTTSTFFVNGLGARMREVPRVKPALVRLAGGDRLRLLDERANAEGARALLVVERMGVALAWVPGVLLSHLDTIRSHGAPESSVVDTNGPDVPPAYRLLVMLRGTAPVGYRPFDGPEFRLASKLGPSDVAACG